MTTTTKRGEYHVPDLVCPKCGCETVDEQGWCENCGMDLSHDVFAANVVKGVVDA